MNVTTSSHAARLVWLGSFVLASCGAAAAQTVPVIGLNQPEAALTMKLGDGTIDGRRIVAPYNMAWSATFYPSKGEPIVSPGNWNESVRLADWHGRKVLVRSVGAIVYGGATLVVRGFVAHVTVVDPVTLAPIWSEHHDLDGSTRRWIFDGTHVSIHEKSGGEGAKEVVREFDTGTPAYDFSGPVFPFYFKALPLKVGLKGVIPAVGEDAEHPLRGVTFKVVRRERVKAGSRMVDAWVVESIHPEQTDTIRFWISDDSPFPIRMELMGDPRESYDMMS